MDDYTWDFFCNNSPRLVVVNRPKTPIETIDRTCEVEIPKLLPSSFTRLKMMKQPASLIKNSFKTGYRDLTPKLILQKNSSKTAIKSKGLIKIPLLRDGSFRNISPLRDCKYSLPNTKKFNAKVGKSIKK